MGPKTKKLLVTGEFFVGLLGLEPRMTEPKSAVLPLHHRPIAVANLRHIFSPARGGGKFLKKTFLIKG